MSNEEVVVSVDTSGVVGGVCYVVGRNGTFIPRAVEIWKGPGPAHISAVGKRGPIRGEIALPAEMMDALAMRWLQARGLVMPAK